MNSFRKATGSLLGLLLCSSALAFPPAPHHTLYGLVRNQFGDPINIFPSDVYLETPSRIQLQASVVASVEPGVNYRIEVPMDSGTSAEANAYKPTALKPFFHFTLKVQIGQTTYVPMEMVGNFAKIGQPGLSTRIDLTLGADTDGDGLPDAWEQSLIDIYGGTLASIRPEDDSDGDGISNLDEYRAGTYAFDPADGFRLVLAGVDEAASKLEFLTLRGRNYTIQASSNLQDWKTVGFQVLTGEAKGPIRNDYLGLDVRLLQVAVPFQVGGETNRFFKALVH